jgi:hypothetical protein
VICPLANSWNCVLIGMLVIGTPDDAVAVGVVPVGDVVAAGVRPWIAVISGCTHGGV